jgi:DNA invertase Pin-like site-specific DNA recombinase
MLVPRIRRLFSAIAKSNSASTVLVRPQQPGANLTKDQILEIEELLIAGQSGREIARKFGVSRHIIWTIDRAMPGPGPCQKWRGMACRRFPTFASLSWPAV